MTDEIRELTKKDFARALPQRQRERIIRGQIDPAKDIAALRRFAGLTQEEFAEALSISVHTLRSWEQDGAPPRAPRWHCFASPPATRESSERTSRPRLENVTLDHGDKRAQLCEAQRKVCDEYGVAYVAVDLGSKVGFALETQDRLPVNGLRHPPTDGTTGWYIWCGEDLSVDADFFYPLHTRHLLDRCPAAIRFLGLPPGYRFLVAGDLVDVWFDETLLSV
jgi:DNA-binding transcriptional regulator YiaG